MENFSFYSPTFFAFGKDAEARTGELVRRFGGSRVLIHYGGGFLPAPLLTPARKGRTI